MTEISFKNDLFNYFDGKISNILNYQSNHLLKNILN